MSRINFDNYEAFLLDMVDGAISAADRDELMVFLAQHPELDVDLDGLAFATLDEEGVHFDDKTSLKKTAASRFEELAVKQIEEGLTAAEQAELTALITKDTVLAKEAVAFKLTKLQADTSIVFAGKADLKQGAVIRPLVYYASTAAATVALLVGVFVFNQNDTTNPTVVADKINKPDTAAKVITPPANNVVVADNNTPVKTSPVKSKVNTQVVRIDSTPKQVEPVMVKTDALAMDFAAATNVATPKQPLLDNEAIARYESPVRFDVPGQKPNLLNTLMAGLRKRIDEDVKDEELALRLDTITKRGPNLTDLAFMGIKGFEKLTGYKPNFRKSEEGENNSSALSIGRYTIIATRPKTEE